MAKFYTVTRDVTITRTIDVWADDPYEATDKALEVFSEIYDNKDLWEDHVTVRYENTVHDIDVELKEIPVAVRPKWRLK